MRILLTGYSGFIGSALVNKLIARSHQVTVLGRRKPNPGLEVEYINCDLVDGKAVEEIDWKSYECIVHLASAGVKASHRFWPECLATNLVGMQYILSSLSKIDNLPKLIWAGTFYEKLINMHPVLWDNPYVATKWTASESFKAWCSGRSVDATLAYFFQVFGPGDDSGNVLSYVKNTLRAGQIARLGGGESRRDWIYIDDVTEALCLQIEKPKKSGFKTVDIGTGELYSIREAVEQLTDALGLSRELLDFDSKRDRHDKGIELAAQVNQAQWYPKHAFTKSLKVFAQA